MAQQINLHAPLLLQPQRQFSARTMAQALGVLALALLALGGWMQAQRQGLDESQALAEQQQAAEHAQLTQAMAAQPPADTATLEAQWRGLQKDIVQRRQALDALELGRPRAGQAHSDLLLWIAQSVPAPTWVTELTLSPQRVEVRGVTLDPGALRTWLQQMGHTAWGRGRPLADLRVEQVGAAANGLTRSGDAEAMKLSALPTGPAWAFHIAADREAPGLAAATEGHTP